MVKALSPDPVRHHRHRKALKTTRGVKNRNLTTKRLEKNVNVIDLSWRSVQSLTPTSLARPVA